MQTTTTITYICIYIKYERTNWNQNGSQIKQGRNDPFGIQNGMPSLNSLLEECNIGRTCRLFRLVQDGIFIVHDDDVYCRIVFFFGSCAFLLLLLDAFLILRVTVQSLTDTDILLLASRDFELCTKNGKCDLLADRREI
jgi:hypothetical protein